MRTSQSGNYDPPNVIGSRWFGVHTSLPDRTFPFGFNVPTLEDVGLQPASEGTRTPSDSRRPTKRSAQRSTSSPNALSALQRTAGNGAVVRLLQRVDENTEPRAAAGTTELIETAYRTKAPSDVKAIGNDVLRSSQINETQRRDFIHTLAFQSWVGPRDEWSLEALWGGFGEKVLDAAKSMPLDWTKSIEGGAELLTLPAVKAIPPKFIADVRAIATGYLDKNDEYARRELSDLGETVPGVMGPPRDPNARMGEIQEAAKLVRAAQDAQKQLENYLVGYDEAHDEDSQSHFEDEGNPNQLRIPARYQHGKPPIVKHRAPKLTYEKCEEQWQTLEKVVNGQQAKYPALFALMHHGEKGAEKGVAEGGPGARTAVVSSLKALRDNISKTRPEIPRELGFQLGPVQGRLLAGEAKGPSQIDWHDRVAKPLGEEVLRGHEEAEFWRTLGLSSLAAAAFVFAEIATFGLATPVLLAVGVGAGAGMAAESWAKAYTLAKAEKANASKETELVAAGQADAATAEAVLNTVMVFFDVYSAFKTGITKAAGAGGFRLITSAENAGAASRIIVGLERLGTLAEQEAAELASRAITEIGVEATATRSGKTAQQLLKIVGDRSLAGARVRAFLALPEELTKLTADELRGRLAKLATEANLTTADQLVHLGTERLGPLGTVKAAGSWEAVVKAIDKQGQGMRALTDWREAALTDLDLFLDNIAVGAKGPKSDSTLADRYLAARLGGKAEELGVGTAKPLIPGTGDKDMIAALAAAADRRALSGKGLTGEAALKAMATEGEALRAGWGALTPRKRLDKLLELANRRLKEIGVPELKVADFGKDDGAFFRKDWKLELNEGLLARADKFDWLLEAVYHEARHAEQAFQVARLKAGEGWTIDQMVKTVKDKGLGIHRDVAAEALGRQIKPDSAEGRQAARWFESMMGAASGARDVVMKRLDDAELFWETAKDMISTGKNKAYWIEQERELWDKYRLAEAEYRKLPEEADAYAHQAKFREASAQHQAILRDQMPPTVREPAVQK